MGGASASVRTARLEGLAFARAWRERNRAAFDAMYGEARCPTCGQRHRCDRE